MHASQVLHLIGSQSLVFSLLAQGFVLYEGLRAKEKGVFLPSILLILALALAEISLLLRPRSPVEPLADWIGICAGVCFVLPALITFFNARNKRPDKQEKRKQESKNPADAQST